MGREHIYKRKLRHFAVAALQDFIVQFEPLAPLRLRGNGGEALFGLVMAMCRSVDPELTAQLHDERGVKPLALSWDLENVALKDGWASLEEGQPLRARITALDGPTMGLLGQALSKVRAEDQTLQVAGVPVRILDIAHGSPSPDPSRAYHDLFEGSMGHLNESGSSGSIADGPSGIRLAFLTPTSFRRKGRQTLLPLPELVFGSLLRKWNAFSPVGFPPRLEEEFEGIDVSRYSLKTQLVEFSDHRILGFVGTVTYRLPKGWLPLVKGIVGCLANYSNWAGVGYKTTMGMGRVRSP